MKKTLDLKIGIFRSLWLDRGRIKWQD